MAVEEIILRITGDSSGGERAIDKLSKRLQRLGGVLTGASDAALITFAKLGEGGAKLEVLEKKFGRMARAFGRSADEMLAEWERAAAGTMSKAELMQKANQAALLGLPVDRLAELLGIARNASEATGESVSYMFDSLVTGIGRQSKLVLDNLGIVFTATEAYEAYGRKIGKAADALTAQEKQAAFLEATLKAASRQEGILGEASENASTRIQKAKAALQNVKDEISKAFIPVAEKAAAIITKLAELFQAIPQPVKEAGAKIAATGAAFGAILGPVLTLKGSLPMIKTVLAAIGGSASAILPIVAVVLAVIGVVKLAARAWRENWGGIQQTVQKVIAVIKPVLDDIANDVRYWVGVIKKELAGIMAAIRAILEPALARLRELFGDGAGLREFMVSVRDAVNAVLSLVKGLLTSLRLLLEGNSKEAWDPLADAGLNVLTVIVIGWRKYISKALSFGWNLVVQLANGIIKAANTVLKKAAAFIGRVLGGFLAPGSPPQEGPLRGILEWGAGLMNTYLRGFRLADFGILRDSLSPLRDALRTAVSLGDISQGDMLKLFRDVRGQVAALIADFRKTGQISESALRRISDSLGEGGEEYTKYLRLMLEHQQAMERLQEVQARVDKARATGWVSKELEDELAAAEEEVSAKKDALAWQQEYLDAMKEGADLQAEMVQSMQELTEALQELGAGDTEMEGLGGLIEDIGGLADLSEAEGIDWEGFVGFDGFSGEFNKVKEEIRTWFTELPGKVGGWIETVKTTASTKWNEIKTSIGTTLDQIWFIIIYKLLQAYLGVKEGLEKIRTFFVETWTTAKTNVQTTLSRIWFLIIYWLLQAYLGVVGFLSDIETTIVDGWNNVKNSVATWWDDIVTTIGEYLTDIEIKITVFAENLRVAAIAMIAGLLAGIIEKWAEITTTIDEKLTAIKNSVTTLKDDLLEIGKDVIQGFLDGLKEKWQSVVNWFNRKVQDLPDLVKDTLGIHSPSTVFAGIGQDIAAGLMAGFDLAGVRATMQHELVDRMGSGLRAAGGSSSSTVIFADGSLTGAFPGVRDGRDAESVIAAIGEMVRAGRLKTQVPGGIGA